MCQLNILTQPYEEKSNAKNRTGLTPTITRLLSLFICMICLLGAGQAWGQQTTEGRDVGALQRFGNAINISGDYAVVGAPNNHARGDRYTDNCRAFIFKYNKPLRDWELKDTLQLPANTRPNRFGLSVAIAGDYVAVAAPIPSDLSGPAVYIFHREGEQWNHVQTISRFSDIPWNESYFGYGLDMDGEHLIIGDPSISGRGGKAAIYIRKNGQYEGEIILPRSTRKGSGNNNYGQEVAIAGNYAAVAEWVNASVTQPNYPTNIPFVNIFRKGSSGWERLGRDQTGDNSDALTPGYARNSEFGHAMDFNTDGSLLLIGAPGDVDDGKKAYLYELDENAHWYEVPFKEKFMLEPSGEGYRFGTTVSLDENSAVVTAPHESNAMGGAYLYHLPTAEPNVNNIVHEDAKLTPEDAVTNLYFGFGASLQDNRLLLGAIAPESVVNGFMQEYHLLPEPPVNFQPLTNATGGNVTLQWESASGNSNSLNDPFAANRYLLIINRTKEAIELSQTTYTDQNLKPGEVRSYHLLAANEFGISDTVFTAAQHFGDGEISGLIRAPQENGGSGIGNVRIDMSHYGSALFLPEPPAEENQLITAHIEDFPAQAITAEFWAKPKANFTNGRVMFSYAHSSSTNALILAMSEGKFWVYVGGKGVKSPVEVIADEWHHYAMSWKNDTLQLYRDGKLLHTQLLALGSDPLPAGGTLILGQEQDCQGGCLDATQAYVGGLDELRIWKTARDSIAIFNHYNAVIDPQDEDKEDLLLYYRFDQRKESESRAILDQSVLIEEKSPHPALMRGNISFIADTPTLHRSVFTNTENASLGRYQFSNIYYDAEGGTDFTITPYNDGTREFTPESETVTLNASQKQESDINFTDNSYFSLAGRIHFEKETEEFPAQNVLVYAYTGNNFAILADTIRTDERGVFTFTLEPGKYRIIPEYADHTFAPRPGFAEVSIPEDRADSLFFLDTTTRTLQGKFVGGSCDIDVGGAEMEIHYGQFSTTVNTTKNQEGIHTYAVEVPALIKDSIRVEIISLTNDALVLEKLVAGEGGFLQAEQFARVDSADATVNFFYRSEPQLRVESTQLTKLENCGNDLYLLSEGDVFTFTLEAYEMYNGVPCKLDSGAFAIFDHISNRPDSLIRIEKADSVYTYTIRAGNPNLIGGGAHPYQKSLQVDLIVPLGMRATQTIWAIVEGNTPRVGQPFVTVNPSNIPLMILRDPPGDKSYSYLEKGFTLSREMEITDGGSGNVGAKLTIGDPDTWPVFGSVETNLGFEGADTESFRFSMTTNQRITTNEDGKPGKPSDVFIGTALNILYGITDVLKYNEEICEPSLTQKITWLPGQIETTYIHSYDYIKNILIPELKQNFELSADPVRKDSLNAAITDWRNLISISDFTSDYAKFPAKSENITFDGDVGAREESTTITKSKTDAYYFTTTFDLGVEVGFNVIIPAFGVPIKLGSGAFSMKMGYNYTESESTTKDTTYTIGYVLDDDDSGDRFSVNITDQVEDNPDFEGEIRTVNTKLGNTPLTNTTPTFRLVGGKSSAPYEGLPSVPRDSVQLTIAPRTQINVPEEEKATFTLNVGNLSQSGEGRDIEVRLLSGSNPDGAIITSGSGVLANGILMTNVGANESQTITFTVNRGPEAYRYENLKIIGYAPAEFEQYGKIGSLALSDTVAFSVYFDAECTPPDIFSPQEGWIVSNGNNNILEVILDEYDPEVVKSMDIQLKRLPTGSWTTLQQLDAGSLTSEFAAVKLDVANLEEGRYQLRAVTECESGRNYSEIIEGIIDRQAPEILQAPLPDNGVLGPEGVIAIHFNEDIETTTITAPNIMMTNPATGDTLDITFSHDERRIFITPQDDYQQLENAELQVSVRGIADIHENVVAPFNWSFVVNRNPVSWEMPRVIEYMSEGEAHAFDARLRNNGTEAVALNFSRLPEWMDLLTRESSIAPGETMFISFQVDENAALPAGRYEETITLETDYGKESLDIILHVSCPAPDWEIAPAAFTQSMVVNAGIYVGDIPFAEPNDLLTAFAGDKLRGVTEVFRLVPDDEYVGFLTVYGNDLFGEEISFRLWDASECEILSVAETVTFENNAVRGNAESLVKLTVEDAHFLSIPLTAGVNWISFNLEQEDMSLNTMVKGIGLKDGDLISTLDGKYAQFASFEGWQGTLKTIEPGVTYKLHVHSNATLKVKGKPASNAITINQGWNPLGFLGKEPKPLGEALSNYEAAENDILRSQSRVATYSGGQWQGELQVMEPGKGYFLKSQKESAISFARTSSSARTQQNTATGWEVNPAEYANYMNITGVLELDGVQYNRSDAVIGAFVNGVCRGFATPIRVMNKMMYFLTAYANSEKDTLTFKVYREKEDKVVNLAQALAFTNDGTTGELRAPYVFSKVDEEILQNENVAPESIVMSDTTILSGQPQGSEVGIMVARDANNGDTHTFSLEDGEGSEDNHLFTIQQDQLQVAEVLNFTAGEDNTYSIRLMADDGRGGVVSQVFRIRVLNGENHVPSDIKLSSNTLLFDQAPGTLIGRLSTTDEDAFDTHTYEIRSVNNDAMNNLFRIEGSKLLSNAVFTEDMQGDYEVVIRTDDGNEGKIQRTFTIQVTDRITGLDDEAWERDFYLGDFTPNPARDQGSFTYRLPAATQVTIRLVDMMGKTWQSMQKAQRAGTHQVSLDLSNLPQGIYLYSIEAGVAKGGVLSKRLIKY